MSERDRNIYWGKFGGQPFTTEVIIKQEFENFEVKYRQQKELLYTGLGISRLVDMDEERKIKEDFDCKFKALLNVPPLEKDE